MLMKRTHTSKHLFPIGHMNCISCVAIGHTPCGVKTSWGGLQAVAAIKYIFVCAKFRCITNLVLVFSEIPRKTRLAIRHVKRVIKLFKIHFINLNSRNNPRQISLKVTSRQPMFFELVKHTDYRIIWETLWRKWRKPFTISTQLLFSVCLCTAMEKYNSQSRKWALVKGETKLLRKHGFFHEKKEFSFAREVKIPWNSLLNFDWKMRLWWWVILS